MAGRKYCAPPIVDSIIELRFEDSLSDADRRKAAKKFAAAYPLEEELSQQSVKVEVQEFNIETKTSIDQRITRRSKAGAPEILQIGDTIFSVACAAPYSGWEALVGRLKTDWAVAKKVWGYRRIQRLGVRYINRLDLKPNDQGIVDYEDFLNLRIKLPESFPSINHYDLSFRTGIEEKHFGIIVRSGVTEPAVPGKSSFLLDIDVSRGIDVPQKEEDILAVLEDMRETKNDLFETFITDEARKLFDAD